jgi:hypothetical protein
VKNLSAGAYFSISTVFPGFGIACEFQRVTVFSLPLAIHRELFIIFRHCVDAGRNFFAVLDAQMDQIRGFIGCRTI